MKTYKYYFILSAFMMACEPDTPKEDTAISNNKITPKAEIPVLDYTITSMLPHDTASFTEGFLVHNGKLFESTGTPKGSNFRSVFGIVDPKTGKIDVKAELDGRVYFGEGIVFFKNRIYQVTYENNVGFIYDEKTFKKIGQFNYAKEGWGMTTDSSYIIMSNGTEILTYFDADFRPVKTLTVTENGYAQDSLNELEYINGYIYANIWMTGNIVKIDPATGKIVARINLTPLSYEVKNFNPRSLEMNGIAYDAANDRIYITGKVWPKIYEVKFAH